MTVDAHPSPLLPSSSDVVDMAAAVISEAALTASQSDADPSQFSGATSSSPTEERQQQVRQSIMTIERSGYRLRSIDVPTKSIILGFDGSVCASEPVAEQPAIVHAVVGTFALDTSSYVLVVTDSRCRGTIAGSQIYEATAVVALPLNSGRAKAAFASMLHGIRKVSPEKRDGTPQSGDEGSDNSDLGRASTTPESIPKADGITKSISAASLDWISPQITKLFGRSRTGSTSSTIDTTPSLTGPNGSKQPEERSESPGEMSPAEDELTKTSSSIRRMEDRVLEEISRLFGDTGMLFSYSYDLTRSMQGKNSQAPASSGGLLALGADVDYWFNYHLQQSLMECGNAEWAVPMIQGSIHMAICEVPGGSTFQVCVLSRRNRQRIGMRYERRGANEQGYVANFVETEQILTVATS
ncbi:hypothetical protein FBU31_006739, partial [Coemansia sp. 'formosensis']